MPTTYDDTALKAAETLKILGAHGLKLATAESCTGGLIAAMLTEVPGSSSVFERGFVTYSNAAKISALAVIPDLIDTHGAVSIEVARAMAIGGLSASLADISVAVTGVAGPGGGTDAKPVGMVCLAVARRGGDAPTVVVDQVAQFGPIGRRAIRFATVNRAFDLIAGAVERS